MHPCWIKLLISFSNNKKNLWTVVYINRNKHVHNKGHKNRPCAIWMLNQPSIDIVILAGGMYSCFAWERVKLAKWLKTSVTHRRSTSALLWLCIAIALRPLTAVLTANVSQRHHKNYSRTKLWMNWAAWVPHNTRMLMAVCGKSSVLKASNFTS